MAKIILRGWRPGRKQPLIPLVKALRRHLACSLPEAVDIAEECTDRGNTVVRDGVPLASARALWEELRLLAFEIAVEEQAGEQESDADMAVAHSKEESP
jgi:hypothetical protein